MIRIFWVLVFLLTISTTILSLIAVSIVWMKNPTIMVIENNDSLIQDIPFPAITICPSSQIRKKVYEEYMNTKSSNW